jgi:hypothetical protein
VLARGEAEEEMRQCVRRHDTFLDHCSEMRMHTDRQEHACGCWCLGHPLDRARDDEEELLAVAREHVRPCAMQTKHTRVRHIPNIVVWQTGRVCMRSHSIMAASPSKSCSHAPSGLSWIDAMYGSNGSHRAHGVRLSMVGLRC